MGIFLLVRSLSENQVKVGICIQPLFQKVGKAIDWTFESSIFPFFPGDMFFGFFFGGGRSSRVALEIGLAVDLLWKKLPKCSVLNWWEHHRHKVRPEPIVINGVK